MSDITPRMIFSVEHIVPQRNEGAEASSSSSSCTEVVRTGPITTDSVIKMCDKAMQACHKYDKNSRFRISISITPPADTSTPRMSFIKKFELSYSQLMDCLFKMNIQGPLFRMREEPMGPRDKVFRYDKAEFTQRYTISSEDIQDFERTMMTTIALFDALSLDNIQQEFHQFWTSINFRFHDPVPINEDAAMIVDITKQDDDLSASNSERLQALFADAMEDQESLAQLKKMDEEETPPGKFSVSDAELAKFDTIDFSDYMDTDRP